MYGDGMMHGMSLVGGCGWVFMLLFWGLVIVAIIYVVKCLGRKDTTENDDAGQRPLDILKIRYAKGEISEEEYFRTKKVLE